MRQIDDFLKHVESFEPRNQSSWFFQARGLVSVASTDRVDEGVNGDFVDYVARARQRPRGSRS